MRFSGAQVPYPAGGPTFLSLNKKVGKELSLGEALTGAAPASQPPSPRYPSRRASPFVLILCKFSIFFFTQLSCYFDAGGDF